MRQGVRGAASQRPKAAPTQPPSQASGQTPGLLSPRNKKAPISRRVMVKDHHPQEGDRGWLELTCAQRERRMARRKGRSSHLLANAWEPATFILAPAAQRGPWLTSGDRCTGGGSGEEKGKNSRLSSRSWDCSEEGSGFIHLGLGKPMLP